MIYFGSANFKGNLRAHLQTCVFSWLQGRKHIRIVQLFWYLLELSKHTDFVTTKIVPCNHFQNRWKMMEDNNDVSRDCHDNCVELWHHQLKKVELRVLDTALWRHGLHAISMNLSLPRWLASANMSMQHTSFGRRVRRGKMWRSKIC